MANYDRNAAPILIAGGGIGGLVTAYALARQGFAGAGVRAGARIPRDRRRHPARPQHFPRARQDRPQGRGAGRRAPPAGAGNARRADRRAGHRASRSTTRSSRASASPTRSPTAPTSTASILNACLRQQPRSRWKPAARVDGFEEHADGVAVTLRERRARRRPRADRLRRHVVEDPRAHRRRRQAARVRPHRLSRRAQARARCRRTCGGPTWCCGPARARHFVHYPLRRGELYNLVAVFHSDRYDEGWNAEGEQAELLGAFQGPAAGGAAHARADRDLAHVGAVRPRAGQGLDARAASRCSATPRIRCCNISRRAPAWRPRTRCAWPRRSRRTPDDLPAAFKAYAAAALSAHRRGCRSWRASTATSITRAA